MSQLPLPSKQRRAGDDDLAVELDRHARGVVAAVAEIGRHAAIAAEAGVRGPVRVVAGQGEVS